jgi:DNA-binding MarR family transcriptional regulator
MTIDDQNGFWERLARAETHALRIRILNALSADEASSPNELAKVLEEPLGNVSYHVKSLVKTGFLELEKTEPRRGAVEHFYRVAVPA